MRSCLLSAFVFLGGCHGSGGGCPMNFDRLNDADHAAINIDSRPIAEIKSPDRLRSLVGFAKSHGSGWSVPWYGTPVARLTVDFYAGRKFLGDFGVGTSALFAQGCGDFQFRS